MKIKSALRMFRYLRIPQDTEINSLHFIGQATLCYSSECQLHRDLFSRSIKPHNKTISIARPKRMNMSEVNTPLGEDTGYGMQEARLILLNMQEHLLLA